MRLAVLVLILTFIPSITDAIRSPSARSQANDTLEQRLDNLARKISDNLTENQKRTIAVVEFSDLKGNVTNFGRFLSEELITRLYQTKKFKVIERQQLNKIIAEQKLSLTGVIDPGSAQKLGRVLGVDSIVFGSVSDLVKTLRINARLIGTETGEVFAAASIEIAKDEAVASLMGDGAGTNMSSRPAPSPTPTSATKPPQSWIVESHFFTFDLKSCRLSGTSVMCEFIITNNDADRVLRIQADTRMFDDFGNEARPREIVVADKTGVMDRPLLISGVKTKARVVFEGVSPQATKLTLLRIACWGDAGFFQITYRDIPLREQVALERFSETGGSETVSTGQSDRHTTLKISPGQIWTNSGIDVEPGMKLNVVVRGALSTKSDNRPISDVLSGVLKQRVNLPPSNRTIGPKALLAKIRYRNGGESKVVAVGEKNTLIIGADEYGRLYFGVDNRYSNSSGSFEVTLNW